MQTLTLKPKMARRAMLFSRTNTMLSIPMLASMISVQKPDYVSIKRIKLEKPGRY